MYSDNRVLKDLLLSNEIPPRACRDVVDEVRAMILGKIRQGGVLEVKIVDRISNLVVERLSELPYQEGWPNGEREALFFNKVKDLEVVGLKAILLEDMAGTPRFGKIGEEETFEGWYYGK